VLLGDRREGVAEDVEYAAWCGQDIASRSVAMAWISAVGGGGEDAWFSGPELGEGNAGRGGGGR